MVEFVEVRGKSVEVAVAAALTELGLSHDDADIEVIEEGKKGFLGVGGTDAVVRVRPKPKTAGKRRRRRRGKGEAGERSGGEGQDGGDRASTPKVQGGGRKPAPKASPAKQQAGNEAGPKPDGAEQRETDPLPEQAEIVEKFLGGLVGAFGLEASVEVSVVDDAVAAFITGDQAETLVGDKGAVMQAVQEVTRTVVQRRFHHPARVRVDVAGYNERRRQALAIYAQRLAAQVEEEGGEIMLEPMSAADRKVVHDTISAIDGVSSYSEGEEPRRCVVISKD